MLRIEPQALEKMPMVTINTTRSQLLFSGARSKSRSVTANDQKKLRGKGLVRKTSKHSRRYEPTKDGLRAMAALTVLRDKVIVPLLANNGNLNRGRSRTDLDRRYKAVQRQMQSLFKYLGLAASRVTRDRNANLLSM